MFRILSNIIILSMIAFTGNATAAPDWFARIFGKNDLEFQLSINPAALESLANGGSDLSKPHLIEHHFLCPDDRTCKQVAAAGRMLGYEASNWGKGETEEGRIYVYFDLTKYVYPTVPNLDREVLTMVPLAKEHGALYDGWGTPVVR